MMYRVAGRFLYPGLSSTVALRGLMSEVRPLGGIAKIVLGTVLVLLMGSALVPLAAATSAPAAAQGPSWAYGGTQVINANGTIVTQNGMQVGYVLHAYYGWTVIYNQTNTSASTYEIQGQRTLGVDVFLEYCTPSCASPTKSVNITGAGWERDNAFANFTNNGTVYVNQTLFNPGTPVTAVALENANMNSQSNITMVRTSSISSYEGYASAAVQTSGVIRFQPALGLYPVSLAQGEQWGAASNFAASMAWTGSYHMHNPMMGSVSGSLGNSLNSTGTVFVHGSDDHDFNLHGGGFVHAINLQVLGPIRLADGWFPLPAGADLFSSTLHPWEAMGPMGATMGLEDVDVGMHSGHMGMVAASTNYAAAADAPMDGSGMGPGGPGPMSASTPASTGPAPTTVQALPMSLAAADSLSAALLQTGISGSGNSPAAHTGLFLLLAGVVVVVVIGAVYVSTRRLRPSRPAVTNYTPYQQAGAQSPARPQPKAPTSSTEKDPLDHLM